MKKEYLTEENYNKGKKTLKTIGLSIMIIGAIIGAFLIYMGITKRAEVKAKWSEENIQKELAKLNEEYDALEESIKTQLDEIKELERVKFDGFNDEYYAREDRIAELNKEISPTRAKMNRVNSEISELENADPEFKIRFESSKSTPFFMFGGFIIFTSIMIGLVLFMNAHGRNVLAWQAQQVMPLAQEGLEKMAPSLGKVHQEYVKNMAPAYKEMAKEISKGIKEGMKDNDKDTK